MTQYIVSGVIGIVAIAFLILAGIYSAKIDNFKRTNTLPTQKTDQKLYFLTSKLIGSFIMAGICFITSSVLAIAGVLYETHDRNFVQDFTEYAAYIDTLRQNKLTVDEKAEINEHISKKNEVLSAARLSYLKDNDNGWRAYTKEVLEIKPILKI